MHDQMYAATLVLTGTLCLEHPIHLVDLPTVLQVYQHLPTLMQSFNMQLIRTNDNNNATMQEQESEDAYFFIREFEEVCLMMRISQLTEDAVRLRFIPFALKDIAKKWLYNLPVSSISSWDDFVKVFLKKFYPI